MRESVKWFAEQMESDLQANNYRFGWDDMCDEELIERLREDCHELEAEIKLPATCGRKGCEDTHAKKNNQRGGRRGQLRPDDRGQLST